MRTVGTSLPMGREAATLRYFFDSSAIVKRYHQEAGSAWVRSVCNPHAAASLYLAALAQVEVIVALRRTGRREQLHSSFVDTLVNQFERHLTLSDPSRAHPLYRVIPLSSSVLALAARLGSHYWDVTPHPLRSLDAIQLAAALLASRIVPDDFLFVTADVRLARIASLEGLTVLNPEFQAQP